MLRTLVAILVVIVVAAAGASTPAFAAAIHSPADGTVVAENEFLAFDWAWDADEYASRIVFTRSASAEDPFWNGSFDRPGIFAFGDRGPFLSSNARFRPVERMNDAGERFAPGEWYWRLCNYSIYGEDDKCSYDRAPPRRVTIVDVPDCADGYDNDGDGRADGLDGACRAGLGSELGDPVCDNAADDDGDGWIDASDPGCQNGRADERADPVCSNGRDDDGDGAADYPSDADCRTAEGVSEAAPPPASLLTRPAAVRAIRQALRRALGRRLGRAARIGPACEHASRLEVTCRVAWRARPYRYDGSVVVVQTRGRPSASYRYTLRIRRTAERCRPVKRCRVTIRRSGSLR